MYHLALSAKPTKIWNFKRESETNSLKTKYSYIKLLILQFILLDLFQGIGGPLTYQVLFNS
jgi:hypothetical protein